MLIVSCLIVLFFHWRVNEKQGGREGGRAGGRAGGPEGGREGGAVLPGS